MNRSIKPRMIGREAVYLLTPQECLRAQAIYGLRLVRFGSKADLHRCPLSARSSRRNCTPYQSLIDASGPTADVSGVSRRTRIEGLTATRVRRACLPSGAPAISHTKVTPGRDGSRPRRSCLPRLLQ